jgi:hypothetical protein
MILFIPTYSEIQTADSIINFNKECLLFGQSHDPIVCDKNGCTNIFCYILRDCNEIFVGTIVSDSSYSIHKDSTQTGETVHEYMSFKVLVDSVIIGQTKTGNTIELLFFEGTTRFKKCRISDSKGDSVDGMEMYPDLPSRHYHFEHGLKAFFATKKKDNSFNPVSGIKYECKDKTVFLECLEKLKKKNKAP